MTVEVLGSAIHLETEAEAWMLLQKLIEGGASVPMIPKVTCKRRLGPTFCMTC